MTTVVPIQVADRVPSHGIDLRLGDYREVLADVECDALILDAPYSSRTHDGHDGGTRLEYAEPGEPHGNEARQKLGLEPVRRTINYPAWGAVDVRECVEFWADRTRGWIVSITDTHLAPCWADELEAAGRYVFSPLPLVEIGSRVRLAGDGPSSWSCWIVVARPRSLHRWGTLPGAYVFKGRGDRECIGGKRTDAMRALVRDYTRADDLVCDPCAGGGTTLIAAAIEGRRCVGAEVQVDQFDLAQARFARGFTPSLFSE
jgi:site-specific DNA-methyltransferase (adenine-specific)